MARGAVSLIIAGNSRPVASASASPQSGPAPLTVTFSGMAEDAEDDSASLTYGWDFDGDGTYEAGTDTLTPPDYDFLLPGLYNAKLRVEDSDGAWDVDTVAVQVADNLAPVAQLHADRLRGDAPLEVRFDASASIDPDGLITEYAWDWSSNGSWDFFGPVAFATYTYTEPLVYTATVRATDDGGAISIARCTVTACGSRSVELNAAGQLYSYTTIDVVNGNPAIAYQDYGQGELLYVRALDEYGTAWDAPVTVDDGGVNSVGAGASLLVVDGRPAIAYGDSTAGHLLYVRAQDATGAAWATPVTVDSGGDVAGFKSLVLVHGWPAISYHNAGAAEDLIFVRATDVTGSGWGTPVTVDDGGGNDVGAYNSMAVVNGVPAIAYRDETALDLVFIRADDTYGSSWPATPVTVVTGVDVENVVSLVMVDGRPAISYYDDTNEYLMYVRAAGEQGLLWLEPVIVDDKYYNGGFSSLAIINGRPAIAYGDNDLYDLRYVRALDIWGVSWGLRTTIDYDGITGQICRLTEVQRQAAFGYVNSTLGGPVKYALYVE
jgi:PKD repeat protein